MLKANPVVCLDIPQISSSKPADSQISNKLATMSDSKTQTGQRKRVSYIAHRDQSMLLPVKARESRFLALDTLHQCAFKLMALNSKTSFTAQLAIHLPDEDVFRSVTLTAGQIASLMSCLIPGCPWCLYSRVCVMTTSIALKSTYELDPTCETC